MKTLRINDEIFPITRETQKAVCISTETLGYFWIPKKAFIPSNNPHSLIASVPDSHSAIMLESESIADWFYNINPKVDDIFSGKTYWFIK